MSGCGRRGGCDAEAGLTTVEYGILTFALAAVMVAVGPALLDSLLDLLDTVVTALLG